MVFSRIRKWRRRQRALLDTSVFAQVLEQGDVQACQRLASQLLAFVDEPSTLPEERALVMPYLARLATHPQRAVRAYVAEAACDCQNLDAEVVFCIAGNEDDIALPFIAGAVSLERVKQLAIYRAGDVRRRLAVCGRADVDAAVVAEALENGQREVVLCCLRNAQAALSPEQARRLYVRHREDEEIIAALLERPDLPLEVRIAHVEIQSGRLRQVMERSEWQAAAAGGSDPVAAVEEQALAEILAGVEDEEQLQAALEFLSRRGKLTAAVLLRAACGGHVAVLLHALAWLSGMRVGRLHTALRKGASLGVMRTALMRSGLPETTHALALAVLLAARGAGDDAARVGARLMAFGPRLMETIAEADALSVAEKLEAASLLEQLGDESVRPLAGRFTQSLLRHAA